MSIKKLKIHFVGIGGIGVSALAKYYLSKGNQITGSDLTVSEITQDFAKRGVKIFIGKHSPKNLARDANLVIYSPAALENNPELKEARRLGIKCQSYPQALGELTKKYFTIAVAGTHGKSTTTAMIGLILKKARLDPTVIVGTKLKEFQNSNCRVGKSQYLVIEADEHMASFLNYWPKIIVLTAVEADHLDYYKNFKNYVSSFKKFISHLTSKDYLIANNDDRIISQIKNKKLKIKNYTLKQKEVKKLRKVLRVPGKHNISNALAALKVARILKIPDSVSFLALAQYRGAWRRFDENQMKIKNWKIKTISDYAHHPTEIKVTLKAAKEKYQKKRIWCVFQPHQYQRTYYLFSDFVKCFKKAPVDKIIIIDIYEVAGRENKKIKEKVSSEKLVKAINSKEVNYLPSIEKAINFIKERVKKEDVIIFMGAGDIYSKTKKFLLDNRA